MPQFSRVVLGTANQIDVPDAVGPNLCN